MKEFLNISMKRNQSGDTRAVRDFNEKFSAASEIIINLLGEKPFHVRTRLSSSTLDSVMVNLMQNLNNVPNDFASKYNILIKTKELEELTTIGTTDAAVVRDRFKFVKRNLFE